MPVMDTTKKIKQIFNNAESSVQILNFVWTFSRSNLAVLSPDINILSENPFNCHILYVCGFQGRIIREKGNDHRSPAVYVHRPRLLPLHCESEERLRRPTRLLQGLPRQVSPPREYWMSYRGPGFLPVVWFGSTPTPFPHLPSASCLSFSVFLYVAGQIYWWERGEGVGWGAKSEVGTSDRIGIFRFSDSFPI